MRRTLRSIVPFLSLLALVAGCGPEAPGEASGAPAAAVEKATSVKVQVVVERDLEERLNLPGTLVAWQDLTLAAETAGPVDWVGPEEGAPLAVGEAIMTIDSVGQQANLERDRVDAEAKRKTMERLARLVEENLVSRQEYDNGVTAFEAAQQQLELARLALRRSRVQAPVAGVLDARLVERGEYVKAGDPVAVVVQVDRLKALIDVPEKDVRYLKAGEEVSVTQAPIDGAEALTRNGRLVHLAYKADPLTRTYRGKVEVDNRDRRLRPGMIVRVGALRRDIRGAVAIPLYAVVDLDGRKVVYVEEEGRAVLKEVDIDRVIDGEAVIRAGLTSGERLIVRGQQLLVDGAAVRVEGD